MKNHLNNNILLSNLNIFELDSTQSVFFFCPPLWSIQCNTYLILHNIDKNISAQTYIIRCGCFFVTSDPLTSMSESYMSPCILKNVFLLLLILFLWDNEPVGLFYCIFFELCIWIAVRLDTQIELNRIGGSLCLHNFGVDPNLTFKAGRRLPAAQSR